MQTWVQLKEWEACNCISNQILGHADTRSQETTLQPAKALVVGCEFKWQSILLLEFLNKLSKNRHL